MLIDGYNHCIPGYHVRVDLEVNEMLAGWIERAVWHKIVWPIRAFYYRLLSYYKGTARAATETKVGK